MKKTAIIIFSIIQLLMLCACGGTSTKSNKLQVYTSFYAMYDFAKEIGGEKADVHLMCPPGQEAHDFEPTAKDIAELSKSDVFIYNGKDFEHWTDAVTDGLDENVKVIKTAENIKSENKDPHVWLNPDNAYIQFCAIADAFCEKDAKNAEYYKKRLAECKSKIDGLTEMYKTAETDFNGKSIVVSHDAYSHFCDVLGVTQYAVNGTDNSGDPTPSRMAEIENYIKANNIKYIFAEPMGASDIIETIAKDTDCEILVLDPFEGSLDNKGYFTVMRENFDAVKKAVN